MALADTMIQEPDAGQPITGAEPEDEQEGEYGTTGHEGPRPETAAPVSFHDGPHRGGGQITLNCVIMAWSSCSSLWQWIT